MWESNQLSTPAGLPLLDLYPSASKSSDTHPQAVKCLNCCFKPHLVTLRLLTINQG